MTHWLKVHDRFWPDLEKGRQSFTVRFNDRRFQIGDQLKLQRYNPDTDDYLGDTITRDVKFVLELDAVPGLKAVPGWVVLGI